MTINEISVKKFGSQGQQRTAMLSLKLAEIEIIHDEIGEYPIFLLDDFASELDPKRHSRFLHSLKSLQVFITTTNPNILDNLLGVHSKSIHVVNGNCF